MDNYIRKNKPFFSATILQSSFCVSFQLCVQNTVRKISNFSYYHKQNVSEQLIKAHLLSLFLVSNLSVFCPLLKRKLYTTPNKIKYLFYVPVSCTLKKYKTLPKFIHIDVHLVSAISACASSRYANKPYSNHFSSTWY